MAFLTDWHKQPSINYCRDFIKHTIARIFNTSTPYEQAKQPCDIATILEQRLFVEAASEEEYMNKETLLPRLQGQLNRLEVGNYNYPYILHGTVPFTEGGFTSTISHIQQQHADNGMLRLGKRQKMDHVSTVQPCTLEGISLLHQQPQLSNARFFEDLNSNMEQFTDPMLDSLSINETENCVIDEAFGHTFNSGTILSEGLEYGDISEEPHAGSHHVTANSEFDEIIRMWNSNTHTICSDQGAETDIDHVKGRTEFICSDQGAETDIDHVKDRTEFICNDHGAETDIDDMKDRTEFICSDQGAETDIDDVKDRTEFICSDHGAETDIDNVKGRTEFICSDHGAETDIDNVKGRIEFSCSDHGAETDIEDVKGIEATHALEESHPQRHHVISNNASALIKVNTEFNQAGKNATSEVDEPKSELVKESNSSNPTFNGVSLTEFMTYDQIREHIMSFRQQFDQGKTKDKEEISVNSCQLCGMDELSFAPLPIHCLSCGVRIKKNASYYCKREEEFDIDNCFCPACYRNFGHGHIAFKGTYICKEVLDRKTNDVMDEPWVQCDICKRWQHQICALFDNTRDLEGNSEYMCPRCCLKEIENGMCAPLPRSTTFGAKDLPRTMLSEQIEQRLFKRLAQERAEMAKLEGKNVDEVLTAENLCVRVVSSVNKQLKVEKSFLDIFSTQNYPAEFNYVSKAIFLFQKIEGVDVCLFGMYVQEFGSECRQPNQRCVYISYLDSVKYLRPQRVTVTGEALRTFIYHEILIGYLEFCKKRGFATCYIWACPPIKGDDYILYCHPMTQKTPKNDVLRHWYHSMLKKAAGENIVVGLTNLYDHFFDTNGKSSSKVTAARLPYFDGDYWSGAAMNLLNKIEETGGGKDVNKMKKRLRKRTSEHTNPSEGTSKDVLVMHELGQKILPFKEDFMIVHLQYACIKCHEVIMSGKRWFCRQCKNFHECERCHTANTHISISGEKHKLLQVLVDNIPFDTKDNDIIPDNGLLENRNQFLSFCQQKHFQFDTLRRAKHSSFMILNHLKNHTDY